MNLKRTDTYGQLVCPDDPGQRMSVTEEEAAILASLSWGKKVLDIGTGLGVSAKAMHAVAREVVTVDPDPWVAKHVILPESIRRMTELPEEPFDFVFIDGAHDFESVDYDWNCARPMAPLVAFHDNKPGHKGVHAVIESIREAGLQVIVLPTLGRLTLVET